mmetsp:Transcript_21524/g.33180  ORF Transcript_21524/g.33180 Transcript_21524/m.33180 type:complete len:502 (+) Transcript_21524:228-1733(+)|eukprot:CAMPEP_0195286912 /NCGR_PEP_ID=MMETSP0707-20130614/4189_1 /TAXON_ID=33640 /ORGANISM="Asterionellopsis glacialis, Strain CCMP134" /LENGTH=501 /DNA_ID=CAMNT_0040346613 /DNA_START=224 /DNA_END=1729 /DNA_ORIENTATION=+
MPRTTRSRRGSVEDVVAPADESRRPTRRAVLGDVSNNRRLTRSDKSSGTAVEKRTSRPARKTTIEAQQPEVYNDEPDESRNLRRSSRSCVQAQRKSAEKTDDIGRGRSAKRSKDTSVEQPKPKRVRRGKNSGDASDTDSKTEKNSIASRVRSRSAPKTRESKSPIRNISKRSRSGSTRRTRPQPRSLGSDFLSQTDFKMVREPFDASKYTLGIAPHDQEDRQNPLMIPEYATDLFQRLYDRETATRPMMYMVDQCDINNRMRAILIDWLVEVHMKFRLVPETLYLCVNIIDRYCNRTTVRRSKLQLVGVTALLIACKYEEIYPPEVRDCVYITDRAYTRQEVLDMEQSIVNCLEFNFTVPTAYPFLKRFLHITKAREVTCAAANYYMERTLQEHDLLIFRPSLVAAASVVLALNHLEVREKDRHCEDRTGVPECLSEYTGYSANQIIDCAEVIAVKVGEEVVTASRRQLIAVKKKYDHSKYHHVSSEFGEPDADDISQFRN